MLSAHVCYDPEAKAVICGDKRKQRQEEAAGWKQRVGCVLSEGCRDKQGCAFPCQRRPLALGKHVKICVYGLGVALTGMKRKENGKCVVFPLAEILACVLSSQKMG